MTTVRRFAAGAEFWEWPVRLVDDQGAPVDPSGMPVEFAAVSTDVVPAATWAGIVSQSGGHAAGTWQGPDQWGTWTARVLVSGSGGGGAIAVGLGTWRLLVQVTASPERPVEDTGVLIMA